MVQRQRLSCYCFYWLLLPRSSQSALPDVAEEPAATMPLPHMQQDEPKGMLVGETPLALHSGGGKYIGMYQYNVL